MGQAPIEAAAEPAAEEPARAAPLSSMDFNFTPTLVDSDTDSTPGPLEHPRDSHPLRLAKEVETSLRDPATRIATAKYISQLVLSSRDARFGITLEHVRWANVNESDDASAIRTAGCLGHRRVIDELKDMILSNDVDSRVHGASALAALLQHPLARSGCRDRESRPLIDLVASSRSAQEKLAALKAIAAWALVMVPLDARAVSQRPDAVHSRTVALALEGLRTSPDRDEALLCTRILVYLTFSRAHCTLTPPDVAVVAVRRAMATATAPGAEEEAFFACMLALNLASHGAPVSSECEGLLKAYAARSDDAGLASALALGFIDAEAHDAAVMRAVHVLYANDDDDDAGTPPQVRFLRRWLLRRLGPKLILSCAMAASGTGPLPRSVLAALERALAATGDAHVHQRALGVAVSLLSRVDTAWASEAWARVGCRIAAAASAADLAIERARVLVAFALDRSLRGALRREVLPRLPPQGAADGELEYTRLLLRALLAAPEDAQPAVRRWPRGFLRRAAALVGDGEGFQVLAATRALTSLLSSDAVARADVLLAEPALLLARLRCDAEGLALLRALVERPCGAVEWTDGDWDVARARRRLAKDEPVELGASYTVVVSGATLSPGAVLLQGLQAAAEHVGVGSAGELGVSAAWKGWQGAKAATACGDGVVVVGGAGVTLFYGLHGGFLGESAGLLRGPVRVGVAAERVCVFPFACNPALVSSSQDATMWPECLGGSMRPEAAREAVAAHDDGVVIERLVLKACGQGAAQEERVMALQILGVLAGRATRDAVLASTGAVGALVATATRDGEDADVRAAAWAVLRRLD